MRTRWGQVLPREFRLAITAGLVGVPVFWLVAAQGLGHGSLWPRLAEAIEVLAALATVVALATAARRTEGRERQAWTLLAGTIAFWSLGTGTYLVRGLLLNRYNGNEWYAELFYLCCLPLAVSGFLRFPVEHGPFSSRLRQSLDALTVASSALFVSWDVALHTVLRHRSPGVLGWMSVVYPVADLALCTLAVLIAARAPENRRISISLLAAAMFGFALADSAGVTLESLNRYHVGSTTDVGWMIGLFLGSLSALAYSYPTPETGPLSRTVTAPWRSALLPYVLTVPAVAVALRDVIIDRLPDGTGVAIGGVVVVLVTSRQMLTVRENLLLVARLTGQESELRQQALHDVLTGLANRRLFRERLEESLRSSDPAEVAVVFVDLDDFKVVNDTMGHATGDELLRKVANRLQTCVRGSDVAARLGGDEFAVLLTGGGLVAAQAVAGRLSRAMRQPILCGGQPVFIQASIGISAASDSFDGHTSQQLLEQADMAMYAAKDAGKARVEVFAPAMRERLLDRAAVRDDLARALSRDQLLLNYQPIVDLRTGEIVGAEALLRWHHPQRGFIPPLLFVPLAEETGLIEPIGRWVLEKACATAAGWQAAAPNGGLQINVNVSAGQLLTTDIVEEVEHVLRTTGLDPSLLTVEITESVLMADNATVAAQLADLRALGIRLAIDDFGTGYSGLSYLDRLPVDILKVDKAFVDRVAEPATRPPLAGAIVGLGEMLGLDVVAEGIETSAQRRAMVELGCRHGQGYLFSKPVDAMAFDALLAQPVPRLGEPQPPLTADLPVQGGPAVPARR